MTRENLGIELMELIGRFCSNYELCEECPLRKGVGKYECEIIFKTAKQFYTND